MEFFNRVTARLIVLVCRACQITAKLMRAAARPVYQPQEQASFTGILEGVRGSPWRGLPDLALASTQINIAWQQANFFARTTSKRHPAHPIGAEKNQ
jgi:hypothetical protein